MHIYIYIKYAEMYDIYAKMYHIMRRMYKKCRPCAYIKRVCPYVAYWYICKKITSMHALCRAQDRGVDVSFPACNKLAVLSVRSILNLFQIQLPLKYWWYAVPCWWYELPVAQVYRMPCNNFRQCFAQSHSC